MDGDFEMKWTLTKITKKKIEKNKTFEVFRNIKVLKNGVNTTILSRLEKKKEEDIFAYQARNFIAPFEGFDKTEETDKNKAYPYFDSGWIPHIGFGFNLTVSSIRVFLKDYLDPNQKNNWDKHIKIIETLKIVKSNPKKEEYLLYLQKDLLNNQEWEKLQQATNIQQDGVKNNNLIITNTKKLEDNEKLLLDTGFPYTIQRDKAEDFLASLIDERRYRLEAIYKKDFNLNENKKFDSYEQLALLSLFYNRESLVKKESGIGRAIQENNRFKVWFEIRYRSNLSKIKGIAKRRFAESNIFGLFDGVERGGFDNTAEWSKKHTPTLQEAIEFMKFLYSPFRKEYDARVKENGQTKIIKKTTNNYIDYIKAYETEMVFEGITLDEYNHPEFKKHYTPFPQLLKSYVEVMFSDFKKNNPCFSASPSISVFSQPLFHSIASTPNITATESIKIALNPINKRLNQIRSNASLPNEAFFISTGLYTPKASIDNQGLVTHILLDTSSHFDCDSFTHPQNIIFYIVLCDRLGLNAKIIKLEGCPKALVEVKDYQIGMIEKKFNGLIQINEKEGVIYCFEKEADGKNSPNLTIYDSFSSTPLVTIFNLRSEGNNNA